jgi:C1A family cysteine protease
VIRGGQHDFESCVTGFEYLHPSYSFDGVRSDMKAVQGHYDDGQPRTIALNGWKRQPQDSRDKKFRLKFEGPLTAPPPSVDLRKFCPPVEDQADIGSCTANAAASLVEANQVREGRKANAEAADSTSSEDALDPGTEAFANADTEVSAPKAAAQVVVSNVVTSATGVVTFTTTVTPQTTTPPIDPPVPPPPSKFINVSRLFTYYATRLIEGTENEDSGAYIRDAIKSMAKYGMVDELAWPYDTSKYAVNPSRELWDAAATKKITSYHAIANGDLQTMKVTLAKGYLIEYGFDVYTYFLSSDMARKGLLSRPKSTESLQGGHAVALCGYDDNKVMPDGTVGAFLARNSWSARWGQAGYFWHAYNYVSDTRMCSDFWAILSQPL